MTTEILLLVTGSLLGGFVSFFFIQNKNSKAKQDAESIIENAKHKAEKDKEHILKSAEEKATIIKNEIIAEAKEKEKKIEEEHKKILDREKRMDEKETRIESLLEEANKTKKDAENKILTAEEKEQKYNELIKEEENKLYEITRLTPEEAKDQLFKTLETEWSTATASYVQKIEEEAKENAKERARWTIVQAMQRLNNEVVNESTTTVVELPSDEMKGMIIGREGRNITAFERLTGVDVIIDDTPNVVIISCFKPERRYLAKKVLEKLLADGRIQPARIEETVVQMEAELKDIIRKFGEKAVRDANVTGIPKEVISILGSLAFRNSYGQNNLKHLVQCANIASVLATELGADIEVAKKGALLHDIGKSISHEIEGPHALLGRDILIKYGVDEKVVHCVEAHHEDVPMRTIEAMITQISDSMSGARPGARSEQDENFFQRNQQIENIAMSYTGVNKAFAISGGRELRVIVNASNVDDITGKRMAKDIAMQIERDMTYPGQIKVNVIREVGFVEFAK